METGPQISPETKEGRILLKDAKIGASIGNNLTLGGDPLRLMEIQSEQSGETIYWLGSASNPHQKYVDNHLRDRYFVVNEGPTPVAIETIEGFETQSFTKEFLEETIKEIFLKTINSIKKIDLLTISGAGNTLILNAKISTKEKLFKKNTITLTNSLLANKGDTIVLNIGQPPETSAQKEIFADFAKQADSIGEKIKEMIEAGDEKKRKVKKMEIEMGMLKVTFTAEQKEDIETMRADLPKATGDHVVAGGIKEHWVGGELVSKSYLDGRVEEYENRKLKNTKFPPKPEINPIDTPPTGQIEPKPTPTAEPTANKVEEKNGAETKEFAFTFMADKVRGYLKVDKNVKGIYSSRPSYNNNELKITLKVETEKSSDDLNITFVNTGNGIGLKENGIEVNSDSEEIREWTKAALLQTISEIPGKLKSDLAKAENKIIGKMEIVNSGVKITFASAESGNDYSQDRDRVRRINPNSETSPAPIQQEKIKSILDDVKVGTEISLETIIYRVTKIAKGEKENEYEMTPLVQTEPIETVSATLLRTELEKGNAKIVIPEIITPEAEPEDTAPTGPITPEVAPMETAPSGSPARVFRVGPDGVAKQVSFAEAGKKPETGQAKTEKEQTRAERIKKINIAKLELAEVQKKLAAIIAKETATKEKSGKFKSLWKKINDYV